MILCCAESSKNHKTPADVVGLEVGEAVGERVGQASHVFGHVAVICAPYLLCEQYRLSWEQDAGLPPTVMPVEDLSTHAVPKQPSPHFLNTNARAYTATQQPTHQPARPPARPPDRLRMHLHTYPYGPF